MDFKMCIRFVLMLIVSLAAVYMVSCDSVEKKEISVVAEEQEKTQARAMVKLETTAGDIVIELNEEKAPVTVKNFLQYVADGFYDGTIFHRVMANFMIQGGGFTEGMQRKKTLPPIVNEASNGLPNDRGTIAMARMNPPNTATSQFFINHRDNFNLNYVKGRGAGYAVFGKVVEGMDVVDAIATVKTGVSHGMRDVPVEAVVIKSATLVTK
ncbi:peptidylprolyl isomerase [Planctomycetota bacterium]